MKKLDIPFKIGMQYENWEFDLEIIPDRLQGCDSYIYTGKKFNKFLNNTSHKTELLFCLDILESVIITLENIDYTDLCNSIGMKLKSISETEVYTNYKICKFKSSSNDVSCVETRNDTFVIICNSNITSVVIYTLLWK